jgi:hypothetical protein
MQQSRVARWSKTNIRYPCAASVGGKARAGSCSMARNILLDTKSDNTFGKYGAVLHSNDECHSVRQPGSQAGFTN